MAVCVSPVRADRLIPESRVEAGRVEMPDDFADSADERESEGTASDPSAALLGLVARGDEAAFERLYDDAAPAVYGIVLRVLRDRAQSEEVVQEVFVDLWRHASRYDENRCGAYAWIMMLAHRRAVDRVRAETAGSERETRVGTSQAGVPYDEVAEQVQARLEAERVRRCLRTLTERQRESVTLAYYGGHSYREVARLLSVPLGTIKTRMRDGLIRLRDCLGVDR